MDERAASSAVALVVASASVVALAVCSGGKHVRQISLLATRIMVFHIERRY